MLLHYRFGCCPLPNFPLLEYDLLNDSDQPLACYARDITSAPIDAIVKQIVIPFLHGMLCRARAAAAKCTAAVSGNSASGCRPVWLLSLFRLIKEDIARLGRFRRVLRQAKEIINRRRIDFIYHVIVE